MKLVRGEYQLGAVGEKTNYRTVHGEDVHVGDIVKVEILGGELTVIEPMVKGDSIFGATKEFVMGIEIACDDTEGTVEGERILEIVRPYTSLEVGEKLGKCDVEVIKDTTKKEVKKDAGEELAKAVFFRILDKAITDLKDAGKDYHGLEFIKMMTSEGGLN